MPGKARPFFCYIAGCDGTGKTTQAEILTERLRAQGVQVQRVWLRFPFCFSLPLLAYARWRGLSWYEQNAGVRHGYWDFRRSRLLRLLLPWTLLFDATLAGLFKIHLPMRRGKTVVCERFVLDILADLAVAFGDPALARRIPGRLYLGLLPRNSRLFILDADEATLRRRREDLATDRKLSEKLAAFREIAAATSTLLLSGSLSTEEARQVIWQRIAMEE
jgi:thymidylate kinase